MCYLFSVSLALKVRSERAIVTRSATHLWRDYLTNYGYQMLMNEEQIDDLKSGLEFGKTLRLPLHLTFSTTQIQDVIHKNPVQCFSCLRLAFITH